MATDDSNEHGHLPAPYDWPKGFGESSWWPITLVLGVIGIYVGAGLYLVGLNTSAFGPLIGVGVAAGFLGLFAIGAGGWVYQAFVGHFWDRSSHGEGRSLRSGMLLFLATDVGTFGAGFVYYFFLRLGRAWPPQHVPEGLLSLLLLANTALLLFSSLTYYVSERRLRRDDRRGFLLGVGITTLLGGLFLVGQAYEYYEFIAREGFTITSGLFASAFFALTGLHGLHVLLGVVLLALVTLRGANGQFSADRHVSVTTVGWYWHFVDAVWLFLVTVLYVGSQVAVPIPWH